MSDKKTLIFDCDGVLYSLFQSQISLANFVDAMKKVYREELHVDGELQRQVSEETISQKKLGMFNYIKVMCEKKDYNFDTFCEKMFEHINYEKIARDDNLWHLIEKASQKDNVVIFTNNHYSHLEKILQKRFGKSIKETEAAGVICYDITRTEVNGVFQPKQDPQALKLLQKK